MDKERANRGTADRRTDVRRRPPQPNPSAGRSYDGRFGSSADAGRRRPTGSYRSQPAGSYRSRMDYEQGARRSPMREGGDSYTRRPEPREQQPKPRKRARRKVNVPILVLAILALLVLVALIMMVVSSAGQTYHQLPTIERLGSTGVVGS